MNNEEKALVPVNKGIAIQQKRNIMRIKDGFKRAGKVVLSSGLAVSALGVAAVIGGPVAVPVGVGACALLSSNAFQEARYKRTKGSMFMTKRNINGEVSLWQDAWKLKSFNNIKGFGIHEKGGAMGLEILVGLENYKQQFSDQKKKLTPSRDSEEYGVYPTVFTTKTHGINIKIMQALEKLGYIQIESKEPKNKSILLAEKFGFKEYDKAKKAVVAKIKSDKETLKKYEEQMYEMKFKLTDKPLDLEGLYKECLEKKGKNEKGDNIVALNKISAVLIALKERNIDLERNELGILQIKYGAKESFAKRVERELQIEEADDKFRESLKEDVETEISQPLPETEIVQQIEKTSEETEIDQGDGR